LRRAGLPPFGLQYGAWYRYHCSRYPTQRQKKKQSKVPQKGWSDYLLAVIEEALLSLGTVVQGSASPAQQKEKG